MPILADVVRAFGGLCGPRRLEADWRRALGAREARATQWPWVRRGHAKDLRAQLRLEGPNAPTKRRFSNSQLSQCPQLTKVFVCPVQKTIGAAATNGTSGSCELQ